MKLTWVSRALHPRHIFRISRARRREVRNVFVRLEHDGVTGYGEASPNAFYDETWEGVGEKLEAARAWLTTLEIATAGDIRAAWGECWRHVSPSRAAQCAIDLALWDWLGKRNGIGVTGLIAGSAPRAVPTFCTIGLSTPEELARKLDELRDFPLVKIKSDATASLETVRRVRAESAARIAVDANCAWAGHDLPALSRELAALGVEFIEQPLPHGADDALADLELALPVLADESCVTAGDIERVCRIYDGFNIKLVKCGGLTPALEMATQGAAIGAKVMVGCMLESSALIAAGAVVAQQSDYADLDGAWLLADDPFTGWQFERGMLIPPSAPGLGVEPMRGLFAKSCAVP